MSQASRIFVDREAGTVVLCSPALAQTQPWEKTREILRRVLAAECVESVVVDRARESLSLHVMGLTGSAGHRDVSKGGAASQIPSHNMSKAQGALKDIVAHLRDEGLVNPPISDSYARQSCLKLHKKTPFGTATAGTIVHALSGRVRIQHPLLRGNGDLSRHAVIALKMTPGITGVSASSMTGSILVHFNPSVVTTDQLLWTIENVLTSRLNELELLAGPPLRRWGESAACLGLAVVSEFFVPVVAPLTAIALVASNLPTLKRGVAELVTLNWRVSALYTVIMGTTLISGQFLAAALMQASITCWHGWSSHRLRRIIHQLKCQAQVPILTGDLQALQVLPRGTSPQSLIGTSVMFDSGAILPYDGIIESGSAALDEKCVRGIRGTSQRSEGDLVFAGSRVVTGPLQFRVTAIGQETRMAKIRDTLLSAVAGLPGRGTPTERGHSSASRFVPFTFATGTAAIMLGDLTTLAAVLRPDFATGPSMSERFSNFSSICHLWDEGWLVRDSETLHRLAKTRTVVVAHVASSPEGRATQALADAISGVDELKERVRIRNTTPSGPGLEVHEVFGPADFCRHYIRNLRSRIDNVAVMSSGQLLGQLQQDDVIRISSTPQECLNTRDFDVLGLHAEPQRVEQLWSVLQETGRPHRMGWAAVVAFNSLAISGAFLAGFTSLHVVLLTNLGALTAGLLSNRHFKQAKVLLSGKDDISKPDPSNAGRSIDCPEQAGLVQGDLQSKPSSAPTSEGVNGARNAKMSSRQKIDPRRGAAPSTTLRSSDLNVISKTDPN